MRKLHIVDKFREEAADSLFNKAQAMTIAMRLIQLELQSEENDAEDRAVLSAMLEKFNFSYIDTTQSEIDLLLDSANVPRITVENLLAAIESVKFDVE